MRDAGMAEATDDDRLRKLIDAGNVEGLRAALADEPALASGTVRWHLNQWKESDPLHYVCDAVFNGWLTNGREGEIARALLSSGAALNGTAGRESPLIAAASLGAGKVAAVLLDAGADVERTAVFGARALHWAAWCGDVATVQLLLAHRADVEARCSEYGATPLFWAVHGYGPDGPHPKSGQVDAARALLAAGARIDTTNQHGDTALEMARRCAQPDMSKLLNP